MTTYRVQVVLKAPVRDCHETTMHITDSELVRCKSRIGRALQCVEQEYGRRHLEQQRIGPVRYGQRSRCGRHRRLVGRVAKCQSQCRRCVVVVGYIGRGRQLCSGSADCSVH